MRCYSNGVKTAVRPEVLAGLLVTASVAAPARS